MKHERHIEGVGRFIAEALRTRRGEFKNKDSANSVPLR